jgi:hypothetical protein
VLKRNGMVVSMVVSFDYYCSTKHQFLYDVPWYIYQLKKLRPYSRLPQVRHNWLTVSHSTMMVRGIQKNQLHLRANAIGKTPAIIYSRFSGVSRLAGDILCILKNFSSILIHSLKQKVSPCVLLPYGCYYEASRISLSLEILWNP